MADKVDISALMSRQAEVVTKLQTRLIRDGMHRPSGEVKDMALALAATVDKFDILAAIERTHQGA